MADRILAGEMVDLSDLPPAKMKQKQAPTSTEGNILRVQSSELLQQLKPTGDLPTWLVFWLLHGSVTSRYPARVPDLIGYMLTIVSVSQKYKWPSWVVCDQNFRMEAADKGSLGSQSYITSTRS